MIIVVALVALRLALPSLVHTYVNRTLDRLPGYGGRVGDIDIHLYRGAYTIKDINIFKKDGTVQVPFVSAATMDLSVEL